MKTDPKTVNRVKAVAILIIGVLLIALSLEKIFQFIGIGLVLLTIPSLTESYKMISNNDKNKLPIVIFIKSFLIAVAGILLAFKVDFKLVLCLVIGGIILLSMFIETLMIEEKTKYFKKELWLILVAVGVVLFGVLATNILEIVRYVVGGLLILYALIMFIKNKPEKQNIQSILDEYEQRYQAEHQNDEVEEENIIDSTADDEEKEEESEEDKVTRFY